MSGRAVKVLHVTEDHTTRNTGITNQVNAICGQLRHHLNGADAVSICAVGDSAGAPDGVPIIQAPLAAGRLGRAARRSPGLTGRLVEEIVRRDVSVVHLHGVWMGAQYAGAVAARRTGRACLLTSHGLLTAWALNQPGRLGALKKRIYLGVAARSFYRHLDAVHAITPADRDHLRRLWPGKRVELIPNAVDVARIAALAGDEEPEPGAFVFLGRLHPVKGVDLLVKAFAAADLPAHCTLTIIGPEETPAYVAAIRADADRLGLGDRVRFRPPVWDGGKYAVLHRAWAVILPSYSEVTGLVNLESAACHTPSVTTFQTGLLDWEEGGGRLVQPAVADLAKALRQAAGWSQAERRQRGAASHDLVARRYATAVTGPRWVDFYRELSR